MAIDTKPNLSNQKFEQCTGDVMNLSGNTQIFGTFDIKSGATLSICTGAVSGNVLTSDASGNATWQAAGITTATNGLSVDGNNFVLGGALTGATDISLSGTTSLTITDTRATTSGITYAGDYSDDFELNSLSDYRSTVTSLPVNKFSGFTLGLNELGKVVIATSATELIITIPNDTTIDLPIGSILSVQQGGAGAVTASGETGVTVDGYSLSTTALYGIVQYWKTAANTWSVIGGGAELWQVTGSTSLVPVDASQKIPIAYIDGLSGDLSAGITGGTNGIVIDDSNSQLLGLGGDLTSNINIGGAFTLALTGDTNLSTDTGYQISGVTIFNTTPNSNTNIAIGVAALSGNTIGVNNVGIGAGAGYTNSTGSTNIFIGNNAGYSETGSSKLHVANNSTCSLIYGEFDNKLVCIDNKLATGYLQVTSGATSGHILTSDTDGNATWQAAGGDASFGEYTITGDSVTTGFTVTHNLGNTYVGVEIIKNVSPYTTIYTSVSRPTTNSVCITFDSAPATSLEYKILITS